MTIVLDPKNRHVPIPETVIFHVREDELDALERGDGSSAYLNLALALLPTGISIWATLAFTSVTSNRTYNVFVTISVVSIIVGLVLLIIWCMARRGSRRVIKIIRNRDCRHPGTIAVPSSDDHEAP